MKKIKILAVIGLVVFGISACQGDVTNDINVEIDDVTSESEHDHEISDWQQWGE